MLGKIVKDNLLILEKIARIYARNPLRKFIPVQGKFSMALFIQKEGVFMLVGSNPKKLVFEMLEIKGKKVKILPPRLTTQGNPFSFFNILNLE